MGQQNARSVADSVNGGGGQSSQAGGSRSYKMSIEPKAEDDGKETPSQIDALRAGIDEEIVSLDEQLDGVLEKNEKDFLMAYRFHMLKVQTELMQLKKKANETELKTLQDAKLAELNKEMHRFQVDCMEVRRYCDD